MTKDGVYSFLLEFLTEMTTVLRWAHSRIWGERARTRMVNTANQNGVRDATAQHSEGVFVETIDCFLGSETGFWLVLFF